jgi:hypothetical protein
MDYVDSVIPNCKVFWVEGNHELRYEKYMMRKAREIYDFDEYHIPFIFNLQQMGVEWIGDKRYIKAGGLNLMHGHEYGSGMSTPINPARTIYLKAKANTAIGHYHKVSEHLVSNIHHEVVGAWSTGCLCNLTPKYRPLNEWTTGFGHLVVSHGGGFTFNNKRIVDNRII